MGRGLGLRKGFLGVGETVGFVFGRSWECTGSARRTSGSDGLAIGTGIGVGVVTATGGGGAGVIVTSGVGLLLLSNGNA